MQITQSSQSSSSSAMVSSDVAEFFEWLKGDDAQSKAAVKATTSG